MDQATYDDSSACNLSASSVMPLDGPIVWVQQKQQQHGKKETTSSSNHANGAKRSCSSIGVHGVRLKHFEQVLVNVLPKVQPDYACLPPPPIMQHETTTTATNIDKPLSFWPFTELPPSARVFGTNPGQLSNSERAKRKEQQLQSMIRCILPLIPSFRNNDGSCKEPYTIVDFGGGSGHLGIPLALLFPHCHVVVVDLRKRSLDLMHKKVEQVVQEIATNPSFASFRSNQSASSPLLLQERPIFSCCGRDGIMENLFTYHGPVEQYTQPFDMALALHLCGEATDVTLRKAALVNAAAIVAAPCCVGKLSQKVMNPNVYHATGKNDATVSYPQSSIFCQAISNQADWDALAKAADYSNEEESRTTRNAARRTAKALLETDRRLFLESKYQYRTALMRMDPWEATPKNDILVAWNPNKVTVVENEFQTRDVECQADMNVVKSQLLNSDSTYNTAAACNDWTGDEKQVIHKEIEDFLHKTDPMENRMDEVYVFPTGMGGRKRKLIHFVARNLDLASWCLGEKSSEKTVAVARRGRRGQKAMKATANVLDNSVITS